MLLSPIGIAIVVLLLLVGRALGSATFIALIMSFSFSATAFAALTAVGGATPQIYTAVVLCMLVTVAWRRTFLRDLARVFKQDTTAWIILALILYTVVSAIIFPRWFAGEATIFQVSRVSGGVEEQPLQPFSLNFTQTAYFVLSALTYFAVRINLNRTLDIATVNRGLLAGAMTAAALGIIDLGGKIAGLGDVLEPIRTVGYSMLTGEDVTIGNFYRISGGGAEASAYASTTLPFLAYSFSYWRATGSMSAFWTMAVILFLLLISTSSTALVGCGLLGAALGVSIVYRACRDRLHRSDLALIGLGLTGLAATMAVFLTSPDTLDSFTKLLMDSVIHKSTSDSAIERGQWNTYSLDALLTTGGVGIGAGTSRTTSWPVAIVSQLGIIGTLLILALIVTFMRGLLDRNTRDLDQPSLQLARSAQALALGSFAPLLVTGSSIDPGVLAFVALALLASVRARTSPAADTRFAVVIR
jgi:hypothetical protein